MSSPTEAKPSYVVDLETLLVELRAEDDQLVLQGRLDPRTPEQATRLGLMRPSLTLIQGGRDAE